MDRNLKLKFSELLDNARDRIIFLKPLRLVEHVKPEILDVYEEIIRSYVFGNFRASCVLSRVIVEEMMESFIIYRGFGHLIEGKDRTAKGKSLDFIWCNVLRESLKVVKLASKIRRHADNILHTSYSDNNRLKGDLVSAEKTRAIISGLQQFIKVFPKRV